MHRCKHAARWYSGFNQRKHILATPNYGYEKRQKELAKRKKKEEKLKQKAERKTGDSVELTPNEAAEQAASAVAEVPTETPQA